jgi:hypothetical protein
MKTHAFSVWYQDTVQYRVLSTPTAESSSHKEDMGI